MNTRTLLLLLVPFLLVSIWGFAEEAPNLNDPKVREKILKEAVLFDDLVQRGSDGEKSLYQAGKDTPYTGWGKRFHDNGKLAQLGHLKEGQAEGLWTSWDEHGKVCEQEQTRYKDGVEVKE